MRKLNLRNAIGFLTTPQLLLFVALLAFLPSCYSVRLSNKLGVGEPDPFNMEDGFYKQLKVHQIDTSVTLKMLDKDVMFLEGCEEGAFHTVEYRVSLGGVLLSAITFGKKRKVKVKYVCLKPKN